MAGFPIIKFSLPLLMVMANCYCSTYRFGGIFGAESHLNLTSTGYGTLKSNDTEDSGIGGVWNGTVYGEGYGNIDDLNGGAVLTANKVVSLKPGDSLGDIKSNDTSYRGKFVFGDLAKRLSEAFFGTNDTVTDAPTE